MVNCVGLGTCGKCGKGKIDVNGEIRCLSCEAEQNKPSGLVVKIEDPGEEKMAQVLAASGIAIPKPAKKVEVQKETIKVAVPVSFEERVQQARDILKTLPMPKDIKQFKAINKAIKSVEKILGE